ncbi:hypothetical protein JIX56_34700 [Streptomyces sp. CA-210063]|uniref:hypothetical protein n=1 Tax=Streptomyces sp. CA-210063 TaxID=2801029 RepID=UPI00214B459A|nr:hypothetical protein [Streptomyces sp. CA-210063]UUU34590.1 hypothetical protein JIX56_34700 [Streptomyces sp. CA-210063]
MGPLRALVRTARMARHTSRLAAGLPADDEVLLDAPDERLGPALVAAGRGEYEPAAKLLATTREAAEWENRDRYALRLAAFAHARDEWLRAWQAATPHDPDLLLIKAELAVARGWHSPARVELLREVGPLIAAAAEGEPRDPVPWRIALDHARGTGLGHTGFEQLWAEAVRRSPHHYGCHVSALKYLAAACCARWGNTPHTTRCSHRECFDFAERAAEDALPGSLVRALPVRAAFAYLTEGGGAVAPRARLDAAADGAIALSAEYEPGDPWPAEVRNLLTYVLVRLERWPDALAQLRMIGPYATSFPWDRVSDDPLGQFLELRDGVRLEVACSIPLRARPEKPRRPPRTEG